MQGVGSAKDRSAGFAAGPKFAILQIVSRERSAEGSNKENGRRRVKGHLYILEFFRLISIFRFFGLPAAGYLKVFVEVCLSDKY